MSVVARRERVGARPDRFVDALPLAISFIWLALLYAWQGWHLATPWLFTDELEFTQLARSLAETGETARRGVPHGFGSLYVFLVAPAWLIDATQDAYETAKLIGAVVMTAAAFPTYALARIVVSRPWALFAAVGAVVIPALAYSSLLISETLAYPYSALCLFLVTKALLVRRPLWLAGAGAAAAAAPFVRSQLGVLPVAFALAALVTLWNGDWARARRALWRTADYAGAAVLAVGAAIFASELVSNRSVSWDIATRLYKDRVLEFGAWAAGALTLGLGVVPVIVGLALLLPDRALPRDRALVVFRAVLLASLAGFAVYTAIKAAYVSTVLGTRVFERNLIYVAPLLLVATAVWLERTRLRTRSLAIATALAALAVGVSGVQLDYPYFEAPGYVLFAEANRTWEWSHELLEDLALVLVGVAALVVVAFEAVRSRGARVAGIAASVVALAVLSWNLAGELSFSRASHAFAEQLESNLPQPLDWVDRETRGGDALYLGQTVTDPTGIHELEFWNRSLRSVWTLDGTAPGPGPTVTPDVVDGSGRLSDGSQFDWVVAEPSIVLRGNARVRNGVLTLYRVDLPLRVRSTVDGVYGDGWSGPRAGFNRYGRRTEGAGRVAVRVSREGWGGPNVAQHVMIFVGRLGFDEHRHPRIEVVTASRPWRARSRTGRTFVLPTPPPPYRVEVFSETFVPADVVEGNTERRAVGVQVGFRELPQR